MQMSTGNPWRLGDLVTWGLQMELISAIAAMRDTFACEIIATPVCATRRRNATLEKFPPRTSDIIRSVSACHLFVGQASPIEPWTFDATRTSKVLGCFVQHLCVKPQPRVKVHSAS